MAEQYKAFFIWLLYSYTKEVHLLASNLISTGRRNVALLFTDEEQKTFDS